MASQACPVVNSPNKMPISSPAHMPLSAPAAAARHLVSRPVTRSTSCRSDPDDVELLDREPVVGEPVDRPLGGPVVIEPGYGVPRGVDRVHRKPAVHHGNVLSSRTVPAFAGDENSIAPACAGQARYGGGDSE